ncbi:MAG: DUF4912 domain-containing protein [Nitrospirae bacterium]|nr:DUF4912 domain-containing protein [Nitrospirota bacterium]
MGKQDLRDRSIAELRARAKKSGITAKRGWGKEDFIKALSKERVAKTAPRKPVGEETIKKTMKKIQKKAERKIQKKTQKKAAPQGRPEKKVKPKAVPKKISKGIKPAKVVKAPAKNAPVKSAAKSLEQLTVAELRTLAKKSNIALTGISRKEDIIAAVNRAKAEKEEVKPRPPKVKKGTALKPARKTKAAIGKEAKAKPGKPAKSIAVKPVPRPKEVRKTVGETRPSAVAVSAPAEERKSQTEEQAPKGEASLIEIDKDRILTMPIAPKRLYVYWEISEDTLSRHKGSLNLKIMDVKTDAFFYVPISERVGEHFISVSSEGDYTIEIGIVAYSGEFVNLVQLSPGEARALEAAPEGSMETPGSSGEGELPEEFFETPESVSSY